MRLFLAINLQPDARDAVMAATAALRAAAPSLRWVDASRLHLTLKFLGEQPESAVPPLAAMLNDVAAAHRAFPMEVRGIGAFPNFRRARVVWMGVESEPRLELLHHDVELACERLGYPVEGRPFRPHLTLARVRDDAPERELRAAARAGKQVDCSAQHLVSSVDLMQSVRRSTGTASRYERLHAAALAH